MTWRLLGLWRAVVCLERRTLEWWRDPRSKRDVLRSRSGHIYDYKHCARGWLIRRRRDELFQN